MKTKDSAADQTTAMKSGEPVNLRERLIMCRFAWWLCKWGDRLATAQTDIIFRPFDQRARLDLLFKPFDPCDDSTNSEEHSDSSH